MYMVAGCASVPCWSRVPNQSASDKLDRHHSAGELAGLPFAFAVRTHLFPEVKPSRLPVLACTGNFSLPQAEFQASLGPHMGETCSTPLCKRLRD